MGPKSINDFFVCLFVCFFNKCNDCSAVTFLQSNREDFDLRSNSESSERMTPLDLAGGSDIILNTRISPTVEKSYLDTCEHINFIFTVHEK